MRCPLTITVQAPVAAAISRNRRSRGLSRGFAAGVSAASRARSDLILVWDVEAFGDAVLAEAC
jgi:hypothetical protein